MRDWDKYDVVDLVGGDRLLLDGRQTIAAGNKAKGREAAKLAATARRKAGPSAILSALQLGQAHIFTQYVARSQIATMLGRMRAEFACTVVAEGLRVERVK